MKKGLVILLLFIVILVVGCSEPGTFVEPDPQPMEVVARFIFPHGPAPATCFVCINNVPYRYALGDTIMIIDTIPPSDTLHYKEYTIEGVNWRGFFSRTVVQIKPSDNEVVVVDLEPQEPLLTHSHALVCVRCQDIESGEYLKKNSVYLRPEGTDRYYTVDLMNELHQSIGPIAYQYYWLISPAVVLGQYHDSGTFDMIVHYNIGSFAYDLWAGEVEFGTSDVVIVYLPVRVFKDTSGSTIDVVLWGDVQITYWQSFL